MKILHDWSVPFWKGFIRWRWWVFLAGCVLIALPQFYEHLPNLGVDPMFYSELLLFAGLLLLIGLLLEILLNLYSVQTQTADILQAKHDLYDQLKLVLDDDHLNQKVVESLVSIVQPEGVILLAASSEAGVYEEALRWRSVGHDEPSDLLCQLSAMPVCAHHPGHSLHTLDGPYDADTSPGLDQYRVYCLPLTFSGSQVALLRFITPQASPVPAHRLELLKNISSDMATAMEIARQRKAVAKAKLIETAQAERRSISHELHDSLGQNLAYLRFKLDELVNGYAPLDMVERQANLHNMLSSADESLSIVRNLIAGLRLEGEGDLNNLLLAFGSALAQRSNFLLNFYCSGEQRQLRPQTQQQILYIFREILINVEKHAAATRVDVTLQWDEEDVALLIADDGVGFNPREVEFREHFGLGIVRERVAALDGEFKIVSAPRNGTKINIWLPL